MNRRAATKSEMVVALQQLRDSLPKPKGIDPEHVIESYVEVLNGVSFEGLQAAVLKLRREARYFPSSSELYQAIQAVEQSWDKPQRDRRRLEWEEDKAKPGSGFGVFRPAPERVKDQVLNQLGLDPAAFLPALDGVSGLGLQMAANRISLKRPGWDYQVLTPATLRSAVERMEAEMRQRERDNDQLPLSQDPEAQARANELREWVRSNPAR